MDITIKNGFGEVSGFDTLAQLRGNWQETEAALRDAEVSVLVFMPESGCSVGGESAETAEFLRGLPYITILAAESLQEFPMEMLLMFDIRLAFAPYIISGKPADDISERYRRVCGEAAAYRYESYISSGSGEFETALVRQLDGESGLTAAVESYLAPILQGKTAYQTAAIAACLIKARTGDSESVLTEESRQFYRLIKKKTEESADGNE